MEEELAEPLRDVMAAFETQIPTDPHDINRSTMDDLKLDPAKRIKCIFLDLGSIAISIIPTNQTPTMNNVARRSEKLKKNHHLDGQRKQSMWLRPHALKKKDIGTGS